MVIPVRKSASILWCLILVGCGTPPEIKQLSTAQIGYFDTAIKAVKVQADTLVAAAEKIATLAENRITQIEKSSFDGLKGIAVNTIPSSPATERDQIADEMLQRVAKTRSTSAAARAKLSADLAEIKAKNAELLRYISKMKDVQVALDAYLQSEQAGERVVQSILKQPNVQSLLGTVNDLLPKVTSTTNDIKKLIDGLKVNSS